MRLRLTIVLWWLETVQKFLSQKPNDVIGYLKSNKKEHSNTTNSQLILYSCFLNFSKRSTSLFLLEAYMNINYEFD